MIDPQRRMQPMNGQRMSVEEYFALDYQHPDVKYEYVNGRVYLMAGGSGEHDQIAYNMRVALDIHFRSGPCFVRGSDMRVQVAEGAYYYPDVIVSCNVADRRRGNKLIESPHIVVEVLSPSNEDRDRNEKMRIYQATPTILEIVLINQFTPHVEVYQRDKERNDWVVTTYGRDQVVILDSLDIHIPIDEIYRDIDFNEPLLEE